MIHPTALVDPAAQLGDGVHIGPYCIIGSQVTLEAGVRLQSHVVVDGPCRIGAGTVVHPFARLGGPPQDATYQGEPTGLEIGPGCLIREHVSMHRGTPRGVGVTRVGARGHFMAYSHIGHDCQVGEGVTFANAATLGGHVVVGDGVTLGGLCAVHQRVRIGRLAMVGGMCGLAGDLAPFSISFGNHGHWAGLNRVGLKRQGFSPERLRTLRACFAFLLEGEGALQDRLAAAPERFAEDPDALEVVAFLQGCEKRPLTLPRRKWRAGAD